MNQAEKIESLLKKPATIMLLKALTREDKNGKCELQKIYELYGKENLPLRLKMKYAIPFKLIDYIGGKVGSSREAIAEKIFSKKNYMRALLNTTKGIVEWGFREPQVFYSPIMVVWNFTQACNLNCIHCYQNARKRMPDELTLEEQLKLVDELSDNHVVTLAFAGGEPLISHTFWEVAKYAHEKDLGTLIATNGTLLTEENVERLAETGIGYVEVSVDSLSPQKHDEFRGVSGYWEKSVRGLKNVIAHKKLSSGVAMTVTSRNVDELNDMIEWAVSIGVDKFYAFNFIPTGRAKECEELDLAPEKREEVMEILYRHICEKKITIITTATQFGRASLELTRKKGEGMITTGHYGSGEGEKVVTLARYIGGCGAGRCYCAVQPNGDVTPCVFMPIKVGNVREKSFMEIWRTSEVFDKLRNRHDAKEHCGVCDYKMLCGGCRARAYGYTGDMKGPDPGCIYNKAKWDKMVCGEKNYVKPPV